MSRSPVTCRDRHHKTISVIKFLRRRSLAPVPRRHWRHKTISVIKFLRRRSLAPVARRDWHHKTRRHLPFGGGDYMKRVFPTVICWRRCVAGAGISKSDRLKNSRAEKFFPCGNFFGTSPPRERSWNFYHPKIPMKFFAKEFQFLFKKLQHVGLIVVFS